MEKKKKCSKCKRLLPLNNFPYHPKTKLKVNSWCKRCCGEYRAGNPIYLKAYKKWRDTHKGYWMERQYNDSLEHTKQLARLTLNNAIIKGEVVRLPCKECGISPAQAHHNDYSKPLEVLWLCKKHHMELHRKYKQI